MLGEPQRTEYDWNFEIFGIPCRVHPFFWLLALMLGIRGNSSQGVLIWVSVVFVSVLVHELGHAFTIRYFGWSPRVVLHSFGGLAIYDPSFSPWQSGSGRRARRTTATQILISLAGPGAGFVLATLVVALLFLTKHELPFYFFGTVVTIGSGTDLFGPLYLIAMFLLEVNIYWGILNLMPIYPLDGGQVARELFVANSHDGGRKALQLSLATAVVLAALCLVRFDQFYLAIMFGYMGYMNYQQLNGSFGGGFRGNPW